MTGIDAPRSQGLAIVVASCGFDAGVTDPDEALERHHAMVGWAEAVANAGAAVTVVKRFGRAARVQRDGVTYVFVADGSAPIPRVWFPGQKVVRAVVGAKPDVVHLDGLVFPMIAWNLRRALAPSVAIVVQDHGGLQPPQELTFKGAVARLFLQVGLGTADEFLFTAQDQARAWQDAAIIRSEQPIREIPEASTTLAPPGQGGAPAARLPGRPSILWVGGLDANKDPLTIIDGFARSVVTMPDAALTMAYGEGDLLPEVRARIASLPGLQARVHLAGRVSRRAIGDFYAGADVFVLGSHREVACFSLIEALSFGVAPVVTDIPAFRALTAGGGIGGLFPPGDAGEFAMRLNDLCKRDLARHRAVVRRHFERELAWPAIGARASEIYASASSERKQALAAQSHRR